MHADHTGVDADYKMANPTVGRATVPRRCETTRLSPAPSGHGSRKLDVLHLYATEVNVIHAARVG
jgi:hypothetical protein